MLPTFIYSVLLFICDKYYFMFSCFLFLFLLNLHFFPFSEYMFEKIWHLFFHFFFNKMLCKINVLLYSLTIHHIKIYYTLMKNRNNIISFPIANCSSSMLKPVIFHIIPFIFWFKNFFSFHHLVSNKKIVENTCCHYKRIRSVRAI